MALKGIAEPSQIFEVLPQGLAQRSLLFQNKALRAAALGEGVEPAAVRALMDAVVALQAQAVRDITGAPEFRRAMRTAQAEVCRGRTGRKRRAGAGGWMDGWMVEGRTGQPGCLGVAVWVCGQVLEKAVKLAVEHEADDMVRLLEDIGERLGVGPGRAFEEFQAQFVEDDYEEED